MSDPSLHKLEAGYPHGATPRESLTASQIPQGEPPEDYVALAREYPFSLIAGGLALGVLAGALLPRGTARKAARGALSLAMAAGEFGRTYGRRVIDVTGSPAPANTEDTNPHGEAGSSGAGQLLARGERLVREAITIASRLRR